MKHKGKKLAFLTRKGDNTTMLVKMPLTPSTMPMASITPYGKTKIHLQQMKKDFRNATLFVKARDVDKYNLLKSLYDKGLWFDGNDVLPTKTTRFPNPKEIVKNKDGFHYVISTCMMDDGNIGFLCVKYGTTLQVTRLGQGQIEKVLRKNDIKKDMLALHISNVLKKRMTSYGREMTYWLSREGYEINLGRKFNLGRNCYEPLFMCIPYSLDEYYFTCEIRWRIRTLGKLEKDISQTMADAMERLTDGKVSWDKYHRQSIGTLETLKRLLSDGLQAFHTDDQR